MHINFNIKNSSTKVIIGALCLFMTMGTSCDKFLDVRPVGELPSEQLLTDAAGFESALYGVYASMNSNALYGSTLSHETIDVLAQYFESVGNDHVDNAKRYNYTYTTLEATLYDVWANMYKNIANVNNVLINLEKKSPSSFRYYNLYKGEALGLRAFMHFDLLRLYTANIQGNPTASGIPYSTKFELSPSAFSPAAKVYDLILADLLTAEGLLAADTEHFTYPKKNPADTYLRDREIHFNLYAVQATLARVYLTKGDKANAAKYAKKVVEAQKFELMNKGEIANTLPNGVLYPKETIFGVYSANYFTTVTERFYIQLSFFSYLPRPDMESFYKLEEQGVDYRWSSFFLQPVSSQDKIRFVKLIDPFTLADMGFQRPAGLIDGINMIRLPEMHYILAESLLDTDPTAAMGYFNAVLQSRGLDALSDREPALPLTIERISAERYKEFIGEGQSFFNMKRLNSAIINTEGATIPASNRVYIWPIPFDEIEYNF